MFVFFLFVAASGLAATGSKQLQQLPWYVITKLYSQLMAWYAYYSALWDALSVGDVNADFFRNAMDSLFLVELLLS